MRPFLLLVVGALVIYLAVTGRIERTWFAVRG